MVDDNKTSIRDSGGAALDGANSGLVDVIFEGSDFNGVFHRQVVATLAPAAGLISLPEPQPDNSHLCFYDGNGDNVPDRDFNQDGILDRNETVGCLKSNISPLNPQLLRDDPESFLPDGFGPVNVILRFEEKPSKRRLRSSATHLLDNSGRMGPVHQRSWKRSLQTEDDQQCKRLLVDWTNLAHR